MNSFSRISGLALGLLGTMVLAAGCSSASTDTGAAASSEDAALSSLTIHPLASPCHDTGKYKAHCLVQVRQDTPVGYEPTGAPAADVTVTPDHKTTDVSYGPADFQSAYAIPAGGKGVTVAIVDAQDDPNAEADLAVFRKKYGLPACTTANGCFKKVAYDGSNNLPGADAGWGTEISLDLDAVSAACPQCNILLVEAEEENPPAGTTTDPLATAVDTAVKLGAKYISNSYGITETDNENDGITKADAVSESTHYIHSGVAIFASSGDSGFAAWPNDTGSGAGANFPADIPQVFAVGGTRLVKSTASSRGWSESAWGSKTDSDGAGNSGCSHFFAKPSYQKSTACIGREIADLSADADPASGMDIYDTYSDQNAQNTGWEVVGGTSLASPLTAGIFAASGLEGVTPSFVYTNEADFNDVTSGENGTCKETSLCNAVKGYDGPTGVGTPEGSKIEGK
jgi:subtilase family serine protease